MPQANTDPFASEHSFDADLDPSSEAVHEDKTDNRNHDEDATDDNDDTAKDAVDSTAESAKDTVSDAADTAKDTADGGDDNANDGNGDDAEKSAADNGDDTAKGILGHGTDLIKDIFGVSPMDPDDDTTKNAVDKGADKAKDAVDEGADKAKDNAKDGAQTADNLISSGISTIKNFFGGNVDAAKNVVDGGIDSANNAVGGDGTVANTAKNIVGGGVDTAKNVVGGSVDTANKAFGAGVNTAKNIVGTSAKAVGAGNLIPKQLRKEEPKQQNPSFLNRKTLSLGILGFVTTSILSALFLSPVWSGVAFTIGFTVMISTFLLSLVVLFFVWPEDWVPNNRFCQWLLVKRSYATLYLMKLQISFALSVAGLGPLADVFNMVSDKIDWDGVQESVKYLDPQKVVQLNLEDISAISLELMQQMTGFPSMAAGLQPQEGG